MQPDPPRQVSRAARAFQLAAAVDLYLAHLERLDASEGHQFARNLLDLTDAMRILRIDCGAFPSLNAFFVELLIGHSELVFVVSAECHERGASCSPRRATLIAAQRRRAENLLRKGLEPLTLGARAAGLRKPLGLLN